MNKHEAMVNFIRAYPPLDQFLRFNATIDEIDAVSLDPVYSDNVVQEYTTGSAEKEYIFAIKAIKTYDTGFSSVNVDEMQSVENFMNWIREQNKKKNFPQFPANCYINSITNLQNMPALSGVDDQGRAEYMFQCRVEYTEEREEE